MSKCFLHSLPWGVHVRYSVSTVAGLSPLCHCHVMYAVALSSYFVVRCKVYSSQKFLLAVHRNQTLKLLWFPFSHLWASSLLQTWILKGSSWLKQLSALWCSKVTNVLVSKDVSDWSKLGDCSFQCQSKCSCSSCNNSSSCSTYGFLSW